MLTRSPSSFGVLLGEELEVSNVLVSEFRSDGGEHGIDVQRLQRRRTVRSTSLQGKTVRVSEKLVEGSRIEKRGQPTR